MNHQSSRRKFIGNAAKAGIGLGIGSTLLQACSSTAKIVGSSASASNLFPTPFTQQPLPYAYNALDEAIDAQTMELHFTKHAATYATQLNEAAKAEGVDTTKPLEDALRNVSKLSAKFRNNGGGHYNHELFWKLMAPAALEGPSGNLAAAINSSFGSFDAFKTQFTDAGKNRFGSGWAWLVMDGDKRLRIGSTPNQDNPLMDVSEFKGFPLLALDVWEHAYYLRYQNRRPDYINNWWKVVNWKTVADRFAGVV